LRSLPPATTFGCMTKMTCLSGRGVIEVSGEDRVAFLQGIVSNDVTGVAPGRAVWAALLSAQGKWLADFFIFDAGESLWIDAERAQLPMLLPKLSRFRLRARVIVTERPEVSVNAAWDGTPAVPDGAVAAPDPRLAEAGWRILSAAESPGNATEQEWDRHRLALGLPDGSRDMVTDKTLLLEAGFDELHGVSWSKGCYMGQELTARTRYRGLIKRRLVPVIIDGPTPPPGAPVSRDGADVGTMRSGAGGAGLATLQLDAFGGPLVCGDARLSVRIPAWFALPKAAEKVQATT
jgi:folate-binding protein YgfZ